MYAGNGKGMPKLGICCDWETSGAEFGQTTYAEKFQGISYGVIVFDFATLEPVKKLYREIRFTPKGPHGNKNWAWTPEAERIHGLSRAHLAENGVDMEDAAMDFAELVLEYFGPDAYVPFLGHNRDFDVAFTRQLLDSIGLKLNLHHVHCDTSGLGMLTLGIYKSKDLFEFLGLPERQAHNALEDAEYTLESVKRIRQLVNMSLGIE